MPANWIVGQVAHLTGEVTDLDGKLVDPTFLRLKIKTPAGVVRVLAWQTAPEIVRSGIGLFYADIPLDEDGTYIFRLESDGVLQGAEEASLKVKKSAFS